MKGTARVIGAALLAVCTGVLAQAWPAKPIKYIVPFAPGGTTDILGRMVAAGLAPVLGQPVVGENRPGQAGSVGSAGLPRAAPHRSTIRRAPIRSHPTHPSPHSSPP